MSSFNMLNIPEHKNCTNCGKCCGPVPATWKEIREIAAYMVKNPDIKPVYKDIINCHFRNDDQQKCMIYPVRPLVCRLFGVAKGMECVNGNSHNIDGKKFLPSGEVWRKSTILAFVNWEAEKEKVKNGEKTK